MQALLAASMEALTRPSAVTPTAPAPTVIMIFQEVKSKSHAKMEMLSHAMQALKVASMEAITRTSAVTLTVILTFQEVKSKSHVQMET